MVSGRADAFSTMSFSFASLATLAAWIHVANSVLISAAMQGGTAGGQTVTQGPRLTHIMFVSHC